MSHQYDESRQKIVVEEGDGRVSSRPGKGYQIRLHVGADGDHLCQRTTHPGTWVEKSLDIYPSGQRDWCRYCLARLFPTGPQDPSRSTV